MTDISARPSSEFSKDKFIKSERIVSSLLAIAYAHSCNAVPDIMKLNKLKKSKKNKPRRMMECYSVQQIWPQLFDSGINKGISFNDIDSPTDDNERISVDCDFALKNDPTAKIIFRYAQNF